MKQKQKKRRGFRIGDVIECKSWEHVTKIIKKLADKGIDAKPTGDGCNVEIIDIDRR